MMARKKSEKRKNVYLIENYEEDLKGSKLPSNIQVLRFFMYNHNKLNETVHASATKTVEKVAEFWNRARIPIRYKQDCIKKVTGLFEKWKGIKKNAGRQSSTQKDKEAAFKSMFEDLFDIAHANALEMISIEEDRQFLIAQREPGRRGAMASVDVSLKKKECRKRNREQQFGKRQKRAAEDMHFQQSQAVLESSTSDSSTEEEEDPVAGPSASCMTPRPLKRGRQQVLTPDLVATLDRNKVSDRTAVMVIGETVRSLGQQIQPPSLNRSSIRRQRQQHRKVISEKIKYQFDPQFPLILHWDGKLIPDLTGTETVDRLPVLVTSNGQSQLLAVPKLPSGKGEAQAKAIFSVLKDWSLEEKVQGMCFDTTSSNTGRHKGACILLEQLLGHELLHIGCRHHVLELIAAAAFSEAMGTSSAPDVLLFKRFKTRWQFIDKTTFEDSSTDDYTTNAVADIKDEMVKVLQTAVKVTQPRDDYRELLELTIIFLGAVPPRGIHFAAPGAMHQARWMAKVIYTFKVWMFRSQFKLTARQHRGLRELCIFFSRIYVEAWATSSIAVKAPRSDLKLLKQLQKYHTINTDISNATVKKMAGQLWFLSEQLVGLALFDDDLDNGTKDKMVVAMKEKEGEEEPLKRATIDLKLLQEKTVVDFTTKNSTLLFKNLRLPDGFLEYPAAQWKEASA